MDITYHPIGTLHTPFTDLADMPIQSTGTGSAPGEAEILPEYADGLRDLDGFSHVVLLYHLHEARRVDLVVTPFLDPTPRGVFATRAPTRPNPIGMSVVPLLAVEGNRLQLDNLDVLDGTPLLDIKPFVPDFDQPVDVRLGWLEAARRRLDTTKSDARFR
jgi:tRNA (adenine37-N6)-methyltransferase